MADEEELCDEDSFGPCVASLSNESLDAPPLPLAVPRSARSVPSGTPGAALIPGRPPRSDGGATVCGQSFVVQRRRAREARRGGAEAAQVHPAAARYAAEEAALLMPDARRLPDDFDEEAGRYLSDPRVQNRRANAGEAAAPRSPSPVPLGAREPSPEGTGTWAAASSWFVGSSRPVPQRRGVSAPAARSEAAQGPCFDAQPRRQTGDMPAGLPSVQARQQEVRIASASASRTVEASNPRDVPLRTPEPSVSRACASRPSTMERSPPSASSRTVHRGRSGYPPPPGGADAESTTSSAGGFMEGVASYVSAVIPRGLHASGVTPKQRSPSPRRRSAPAAQSPGLPSVATPASAWTPVQTTGWPGGSRQLSMPDTPVVLSCSPRSTAAYDVRTPVAPSPGHFVPLVPSPPPASWVQQPGQAAAASQEDIQNIQGRMQILQGLPGNGLVSPGFLGGEALARVDEAQLSRDWAESPNQSFAPLAVSYDYDAAAKAAEDAVAAAERMLSQNDDGIWNSPMQLSNVHSDGPQRMGSTASVYRMASCASGSNGVFRRDSMNSNGVHRLQSAASGPMRMASQASGGHRLSSSPHSFDTRRECQVAVTGNFR